MVDVNTLLLMLLYILGAVLLVTLIILVIKLINVVDRCNKILDNLEEKVAKFERIFNIVDIVTDNMALISDKIVDGVSGIIKKFIYKKDTRKEAELNEK